MGNTCCRDDRQTAGKAGAAVEKASAAFFDALPTGVQEATVDHVYDGDTLTIHEQNRMRVRLLGIDAPELKEKEPYSKEAADFVKQLCPPRAKIWLKVQRGEKTDRHNRTLAYVFVANPKGSAGFICVNIAVLEQGLGNFYAPSGTSLEYREPMLAAQKSAVERRLNLWKRQNLSKKVFCTQNGIAFHRSDCLTIQHTNPNNLRPFSVGEALQSGRSPCRECKPLSS